ncbi:MAG: EamA family transporter, partial [Candidatus Omnitrophica bacterium]|nr:EamA family transporter [Candidatus Omnitrophota bacterium]
MKKNNLILKVIPLILLTGILESAYEICAKKGMLLIGSLNLTDLSFVVKLFAGIATTPLLWLALALVVLDAFLWLAILSKIDLSIAFPAGSLSYILVLFLSSVFLHEHVYINRFIGTAFVILGIFFIAKSSEETVPGTQNTTHG